MTTRRPCRRSRKVSALLAATAALGLAGIATLATWTVTEYATGHFKTKGRVVPGATMEASADGVNFGTHTTVATALSKDLVWSSDPEAARKGTVLSAEYYLRAASGSNTAVEVAMATQISGEGLKVTAFIMLDNSAKCTPSTSSAQSGALSLTVYGKVALASSTSATPGPNRRLCLQVEPTTDEFNSTAIFKFTGTSLPR